MNSVPAPKAPDSGFKPLPKNFNFKKFSLTFSVVNNPNLTEIQNLGRRQCLGKSEWPLAGNVNAWMITAETATFMKWGGLGMVASELPEAFNRSFAGDGDVVSVVTPLYAGDTGKKKARLEADVYYGAEKIGKGGKAFNSQSAFLRQPQYADKIQRRRLSRQI